VAAGGTACGKSKQSQQPLHLGVSALSEADTTDAGSCVSDMEQSDSQVSNNSGINPLQRGCMHVDKSARVRHKTNPQEHALSLDLLASQSRAISRRGALRAAGHKVLRQLQTSPPSQQVQCDHHYPSLVEPEQSPPMPRFLRSPPVMPESRETKVKDDSQQRVQQDTSDLQRGQDVSEVTGAPVRGELPASLCIDGEVFNPSLPVKKRLLFLEPKASPVSFDRELPLYKLVTGFLLREAKSVLAE